MYSVSVWLKKIFCCQWYKIYVTAEVCQSLDKVGRGMEGGGVGGGGVEKVQNGFSSICVYLTSKSKHIIYIYHTSGYFLDNLIFALFDDLF